MKVEVRNSDVVLRAVRAKAAAIEQRFEQVLADEATRIVVRTRRGEDVQGQGFAPYTRQYNRFKGSLRGGYITRTGKAGKNAKQVKGRYSVVPQKVDLTLTGEMLSAIQTRVQRTATGLLGIIGFGSAFAATKARGNMRKRNFFGLSSEQIERLKAKLLG